MESRHPTPQLTDLTDLLREDPWVEGAGSLLFLNKENQMKEKLETEHEEQGWAIKPIKTQTQPHHTTAIYRVADTQPSPGVPQLRPAPPGSAHVNPKASGSLVDKVEFLQQLADNLTGFNQH